MSAKKILVVDDDLFHLKLMRKLRYEEHLSLIITDLRMPWLNGLDFCRRVKILKPDLKIYALSGCVHNFDMNELANAGFDGIYQKPIIKSKLAEILNDNI
jgi:CheY-like chemotaxis protein